MGEKICINIIEKGQMTKDLALMVGPDQKWLTTNDFFKLIRNRIENS